ncbi:MAG TPA: CBS domain-containing protein [Solirubrobacteraceae bacterium]|nr:CBS domain-containing protein [Solirubrobacteraceae bacterium]
MATENVTLESAGPLVADVMLRAPRTVAPAATVADARRAFENPRERLLLVAGGATYVGVIGRDQLEGDVSDQATLGELVRRDWARVTPHDTVSRALELLDANGADRLPVVTDGGELVGLVCFNQSRACFCVDAREGPAQRD